VAVALVVLDSAATSRVVPAAALMAKRFI